MFLAHPGHEFWPDDVTLPDRQRIQTARLLDSVQVTDSYRRAWAAQSGKLATFDQQLVTDVVVNGARSLHQIGSLRTA